jgi:energy-converting hydrogenase Eha subunit A
MAMDPTIRHLIKIAVFALCFFITSRFVMKLRSRKNQAVSWTDPETIFPSGIIAALLTIFIMKIFF